MALKIDFIDSGPYRFKAQSLATEGPADDASSSAPANVAALSNPACRPSGRVSQFGQLAANNNAPPVNAEVARIAALILGSPEFQQQ